MDEGAGALDLSQRRRLHVVGIGGAGMGPIAEVLAAMGHRVSGSDVAPSPRVARLVAAGVDARTGHSRDNVGDVDAVIVSSAVRPSNPEVLAATERGIPVLRRAQALSAIAALRRTVAVTGTHGKTTTSAMLALALSASGLRPSALIGGDVADFGSGAVWDDGEWLVVEADESDGTFLELTPEVAVVTSVEPDHLDHYGDFDRLAAAFDRFLARVGAARVVCADDPGAAELAARYPSITYGTAPGAHVRLTAVQLGRWASKFTVEHGGEALGSVSLPAPGLHNARNAVAAVAAALACGAEFQAAATALSRYRGVARRFQYRGEWAGATIVEDYAHLPTEVQAAVATARQGGWSRVVCVFQPHRYSRTEALWADFAHCFDGADILVLSEIYPAGEEERPGVSAKLVVDAVLDADPARRVVWMPRPRDIVRFLAAQLRPGDVCLVLGAGDIAAVVDHLLATPVPESRPA